jgi:hypothetical protein
MFFQRSTVEEEVTRTSLQVIQNDTLYKIFYDHHLKIYQEFRVMFKGIIDQLLGRLLDVNQGAILNWF